MSSPSSKVLVKKHVHSGKLVLAVCDQDVFGKKFEQGELCLDLTSAFYRGETMELGDAEKLFRRCHLIMLVGKEAVGLGVKQGLIDPGKVLKVKGVPYAQAMMVNKG